jgi:hypothetical protein
MTNAAGPPPIADTIRRENLTMTMLTDLHGEVEEDNYLLQVDDAAAGFFQACWRRLIDAVRDTHWAAAEYGSDIEHPYLGGVLFVTKSSSRSRTARTRRCRTKRRWPRCRCRTCSRSCSREARSSTSSWN